MDYKTNAIWEHSAVVQNIELDHATIKQNQSKHEYIILSEKLAFNG